MGGSLWSGGDVFEVEWDFAAYGAAKEVSGVLRGR
jgi:hypothetical protein